jgi:molecular chaperone DnaK (HSP70)
MGKAAGVDLGTTNPVVAVMEGGKPAVIINNEVRRLTPPVVAFTKPASASDLQQLASGLAANAYTRAAAGRAQGPGAQGPQERGPDDVIDAEFKPRP